MFSTEKCSGRSGTGTSEESELFTGGREILGKEGVPTDEVASAVAAVSDEIGDILKDELGDADRAERIGAELADLSAELGLLAGLADGEPQQNFPSLFEIAMGHRGSASGSSTTSSSWSGSRSGRGRRSSRPQRASRRRPIAKGKEVSRRRSAAARRAASMRVRRVEVVSDASDVGADSDSDDQWTELDDGSGSSDSSSIKATASQVDCNGYQHSGAEAEAPIMGQFLLPLLSADPTGPEPEHFLIRHEDILQLLASAEESVRDEVPPEDDIPEITPDMLPSDMYVCEEPTVTPADEAALLHYVCESERMACEGQSEQFTPVEEWLLGVYHSWCEISALMYTLIGTNMSVERVTEEWVYRARFGCHCRLCLCLANNCAALEAFLRDLVVALAHGATTVRAAANIVRALGLRVGAGREEDGPILRPTEWDLLRLYRTHFSEEGAGIIHRHLCRLAQQSEIAAHIVNKVCLCREDGHPLDKQYAVDRFLKILEHFKGASTITYKVEMVPSSESCAWVQSAQKRLSRYLQSFQCSTSDRLRHMAARSTPRDLNAWSGYKHRCDCLTPRTLCAQQRKQLLRISFYGMMQAVNEFNGTKTDSATDKAPNDVQPETAGRELQQGDGTGAKPPDNVETQPAPEADTEQQEDHSDHKSMELADDITDSDANSGTASLGLSTSSSLDSASELLLAAAAAVESGGSEGEAAPGELCRTVRHLMRSIASIERLMDRVLKHCDEWPTPPSRNDLEAKKRVDMGLSEVDRKLMAMYRRLPEVHRRQLQVYRKQKKLSTVCMQLVGGRAPAPPPPGSPPPTPAHQSCRALCPEYHLQRFKEVRRKVMHMRDQQLYYHRLRMWLEDQLRHERESQPESNVTLVEELPRRKRRTASPKVPRLTTAAKRKLKPVTPCISKPQRILQMLKHKAPAQTTQLLTEGLKLDELKENDDEPSQKSEAEPPEAFPLEKEDNISDADTIVGEKETGDLCKEMKECLAKFANFALNSPDNRDYNMQPEPETKYPESVSPPLQQMSPTTTEPMPVYTPKPSQRLLAVNKFLNRSNDEKMIDFQSQVVPEVLNVPLNARRTPLLVKDESGKDPKINNVDNETTNSVFDTEKDPNLYKYVTFGFKIKNAMEECQNIINSYNSIKDKDERKDKIDESKDGPLSLEQICEVMMNLDENSAEFLEKIDCDEAVDLTTANTKLAELVENMPQILANMPEIASKLSEFANASFELPEFASIMNSLPDVNNEAQLTPETLKQIRELKLNKCRDNVKVTKNTAKRKSNRRIKNNIESDVIGTMTFELESIDIADLLKDEKELHALMKNKTNSKEGFKDLLFSISAQVVINKVYEYLKQSKSPDLAKCLEEDKDFFAIPKNCINSEMYSKASTLFDNSVKDARSMDELRELVKSRFSSWKHYVLTKFKSMPLELLENEIETMLDKFYSYIQDLSSKQCASDRDKISEKLEDLLKNNYDRATTEESVEKIKNKLFITKSGNVFDMLIMKLSKRSQEQKYQDEKYEYMDVVKRCADSQKLPCWILSDPDVATNVIREVTGLPINKIDNIADVNTMPINEKRDYFLTRLKEMNRAYMDTLPKKSLTGDEWLVVLYRLEQLEEKIKGALTKVIPPAKPVVQNEVQNASEAEILVAKGLSKILGNQCNIRVVKKNQEQPKPEKVENVLDKVETEPPKENVDNVDHKSKNDALLAKCEEILISKGEKSLLDSFYLIKSYITQGLPVPELYKQHVISIYSSIDWKSLDENIDETLKEKQGDNKLDQNNVVCEANINKDKNPLSIGNQSPEMLAKYSAQALRNAKQTLNAVAFRNMVRNGQSKSESDACDTPKSDCKWTSDCICNNCKANDVSGSVCLGDIVKQCCDADPKSKNGLETKKEVKQANNKPSVKQTKSKSCENATHQQHVCKVGHSGGNGSSTACAGDSNADQPCTCCYCTVFGHAPPLTTPVPRNFNETRERLRSILNKKKQKCKTTNGEPEVQEKKQVGVQTQTPDNQQAAKQKPPPQPSPRPPALPKTLPPNLTPQAQQKRQNLDNQQKQLAEGIARLSVSDNAAETKPKVPDRPPVPPNVSPAVKTEGKVNPNAMEQIRLQQLKQQQIQYQQQQQLLQQQMAAAQQKKPEPIYDLPIHNRPKLTPEQQQQILHQQLLLQQQNEQRQSRAQQQRTNASVSSRASSLFSTSSGCSGGSCWRGDSACREDPRDLDALLQYIEGPTRHVDRGKKRAKKQRQKAKKMEARLLEEVSELTGELSRRKAEALELQRVLAAARRHADEAAQSLQNHHKKIKGKKNKQNAGHQAKTVMLMEKLGKAQGLKAIAAKEVQGAERRVAECLRQLQECELQLAEARAVQLHQHMEQSEVVQKQQQPANNQQHHDQLQQQMKQQQHQLQLQQTIQQQQQQHLQNQQHQQQLERQMQLKQLEIERKNAEMLDPTTFLLSGGSGGDLVRVRRSLGDGTVTVSLPHGGDLPLARLLQNNQHLTVLNVREEQSTPPALPPPPPKPVEQKKQTWEQALAHINQLAKGNKDKKKQKEAQQQKPEVKPTKELPKPAPVVETQPLSKKQRKLHAKQQAEEEEKLRQQQEVKSKKNERKKQETSKVETSKKSDKVAELNKKTEPQKKKEDKKENKKQEKTIEKKGKDNKVDKSAPIKQIKQTTQPQQHTQINTKKEGKKKDQPQKQVINITPETTIEMVDKMNTCHNNLEKPASCSIMEQLSCGVQVADLKLPPGITLTRVQPNEKKEPPQIKSVPLWKCNQLPATPTPVARPAPVINADPAMMMFTTAQPEQPKPTIVPEPQPQPAGKSKKAKKKAKKAAAAAEMNETAKQDGTKMVTLRNPMFHPNLPPVQIANNPAQKKTEQIRIPDPIPMPPNACQATITPTSNGMYTIRNPLMSMMHQQNLMGMINQRPQMNPVFGQPQYNYVNPNVYPPVQNVPTAQTYVLDPSRSSPKNQDVNELQNRIMNLASFTQKNDEGYSLFKTPEDNQQRNFLAPEHFPESQPPKPVVSPNPIGTRPNNDSNRSFDSSDSSLFSNPIQRPEPIGTPLKREEDRNDFTGGLYTPFGQEDRNVFRNALFDKSDGSNVGKLDDVGPNTMCNGDPLPYFQQLRVGSKLNNEVTVHHVTESKFYKGQEATMPPQPLEKSLRPLDESLFSRPIGNSWQEGPYGSTAVNNKIVGGQSSCSSSVGDTTSISASASVSAASAADSGGASPHEEEPGFGPIGARQRHTAESSVFLPNRSITNLSSLEVSEREIESFKRFDFYFEPPRNKPKVQLDVRDIAAALKQNHK